MPDAAAYLRSYVHAFIECFAPDLPRPVIELAAAAANDAWAAADQGPSEICA